MARSIKKLLERERREIEQAKTSASPIRCIYDAFTRCSPHLDHPDHLRVYVAELERGIKEGGVEISFAAPPQHGKTEVAKHAFILADQLTPGRRHAYATYNADRARKVREQVKKLAFQAGLDPHTSSSTLYFGSDTTIQFVGRGGGLTGDPIDGLLVVDDILKDRAEASSPTIRDTCWEWFTDVAETRCHPCASKLVMMTRWSVDDLTARLIKKFGWPYIRLAAVCDSNDDPNGRQLGEALWEDKRPREWLKRFERSPMTWASMYQGRPRPVGDSLFQEAYFYDSLPEMRAFRQIHGCDLAYTAKTRADWSVLLSGRVYDGHLWIMPNGHLRQQVQADVFTSRMAARVQQAPGPVLWYGNTIERGMAPLIQKQIPTFQARLAANDKYVRAIPTAEQLWNQGKVLLPREAEWVDEFVTRVMDFTGEDGGVDDEIDALAALGDLAIGMMGSAGSASSLNARLKKGKGFGGRFRLVG